jgi:hypothetical protein
MTGITTIAQDEDNNKRSTFQLSQDRQVIEARILDAFRDRREDSAYVLPYSELNNIVRGDVQKDTNLSSKVTAACRSVSKRLKITLGRDPNRGGIVLIPFEQYDGYSIGIVNKNRRKLKRSATEIHRISQHEGVPDSLKPLLMARSAILGTIAAFTGKSSLKRIESEAQSTDGQPLSLNQTIDAFKKKS